MPFRYGDWQLVVGHRQRGAGDGRGRCEEEAEDGEEGKTGEEDRDAAGRQPRHGTPEYHVLFRHCGNRAGMDALTVRNGAVSNEAGRMELAAVRWMVRKTDYAGR